MHIIYANLKVGSLPTSSCIFLFCSIEEDYVPKAGDIVSFKKSLIPPKNEKFQAVHVKIIHAKEGVEHERWDAHMPHH